MNIERNSIATSPQGINRSFMIGIILNTMYVVVEIIYGLIIIQPPYYRMLPTMLVIFRVYFWHF
jgi:hypothetical protein